MGKMTDHEWQLPNLELSKKLKKLGFKQESLWYWITFDYLSDTPVEKLKLGTQTISYRYNKGKVADSGIVKYISAFTVAELGEMLPRNIKSWNNAQAWICDTQANKIISTVIQTADTEANARAKMLIYLKENSLLEGR